MDIIGHRKRGSHYDEDDQAFGSNSCPLPESGFWMCEKKHSQVTHHTKPFVVGVTGGTASGKTTTVDLILTSLDTQRVATISLDSYYKALSPEEIEAAHSMNYNFDHPNAFDWVLLEEHLSALSRGKSVKVPVYDFATHSRSKTETQTIHGSITDIIVLEGILIFHKDNIVDLMDMKVFVDTDADIRLARRVRRDIAERGRDLNGIVLQYEKFVKPAFDQFILPTKKKADVVIPRGATNTVAMDLLVQHIGHKLQSKSQRQNTLKLNALI
eukprot:TRINITY_DN1908_c0_g1_i1.p1 TRINITY_DN1908_c0_g1~~TRINITY_DN1908_c0_g1_i1.p1  ORF type:complete len:270 (-),score=48.07 TRINITY_DN1908_c0_g1_i1:72-881(-)